MKKTLIILLSMLCLIGCTTNNNEQPQTTEPTQTDNSEENEVKDINFFLSSNDAQKIRDMLLESHVYDTYIPEWNIETDYSHSGAEIYQNTIGLGLQQKDYPTLSITRTVENDEFKYSIERFYQYDMEFKYKKNDTTRRAQVTFIYLVEPEFTGWWENNILIVHLYVPNATGSNQINYQLFYDNVKHILLTDTDSGREEIEFAKDLQAKLLELCKQEYENLMKIDEGAVDLAQQIIDYVEEKENRVSY